MALGYFGVAPLRVSYARSARWRPLDTAFCASLSPEMWKGVSMKADLRSWEGHVQRWRFCDAVALEPGVKMVSSGGKAFEKQDADESERSSVDEFRICTLVKHGILRAPPSKRGLSFYETRSVLGYFSGEQECCADTKT